MAVRRREDDFGEETAARRFEEEGLPIASGSFRSVSFRSVAGPAIALWMELPAVSAAMAAMLADVRGVYAPRTVTSFSPTWKSGRGTAAADPLMLEMNEQ